MLLLLLILSLSFGQLGRIVLFPGINLYLQDILILSLILFNLPQLVQSKTYRTPLTKPILVFATTTTISLLLSLFRYPPTQVFSGSLYLFRFLAYALIFFIARKSPHKQQLLRYLSITGLAVAVFGLIQYAFVPDTRFLYDLGWDRHYYRLISTFLDPNFTGIFLVLTLILLWPSPLTLLPFIALLLTYSRSSYLSFLAVLIAWLHHRHQLKLLVYLITGFLVLLFILPRPGGEGVKLERLYSLTNRLDSMKLGWQIFRNHPLTGVGFNLLRYEQANLVSHSGAGIDNSFIFILATTGIPGFLAYLWLLKKQLFASRLPRGAALRGYMLYAILVHSFFNNTLFYPPIVVWMWLLFALDS